MNIRHFSIPLIFSLMLGGLLLETQLAKAQTQPLQNNGSDDGVNMTNSDDGINTTNTEVAISSDTYEQLRAVINDIPESLQQEPPQSEATPPETPEPEITQPQLSEQGEKSDQPEAPEEEEERQMQEQKQQAPVRGLW